MQEDLDFDAVFDVIECLGADDTKSLEDALEDGEALEKIFGDRADALEDAINEAHYLAKKLQSDGAKDFTIFYSQERYVLRCGALVTSYLAGAEARLAEDILHLLGGESLDAESEDEGVMTRGMSACDVVELHNLPKPLLRAIYQAC